MTVIAVSHSQIDEKGFGWVYRIWVWFRRGCLRSSIKAHTNSANIACWLDMSAHTLSIVHFSSKSKSRKEVLLPPHPSPQPTFYSNSLRVAILSPTGHGTDAYSDSLVDSLPVRLLQSWELSPKYKMDQKFKDTARSSAVVAEIWPRRQDAIGIKGRSIYLKT